MSDDYIVFGSPSIGEEEIIAVTETLRSCWIGTGPRVAQFENSFADYVGAKHAVAVNSCTAALHLSLLASGIGPGDEVITTPMTFAATANAIIHTGASPVFVDVDRNTMNIDPNQIEDAISAKTRAILPVHFAGRPCDMDAIGDIASRRNLVVIEDAAHCIEGVYKGNKIGTISPLTCFSFYVTKNLTTAEGGMICTDNTELANRMKVQALHGLSRDAWNRFSDTGYRHYEVIYPGYKYNMTDIQAAIGLCQLRKLPEWFARREELWSQYDAAFATVAAQRPSPPEPNTTHARHLYTLLIDAQHAGRTRDEVMQSLHEEGIGTGVHYRSIHLHKYYADRYGYSPKSFPNSNWISDRTLSLPLSAKLDHDQVDRIMSSVKSHL